ncbi:MAG: DM13 domain-containing protein [Cyanobacteria bacterium P01_D01_bin.36]
MANFLSRPCLTSSLVILGTFTVSACTTPASSSTLSETPTQSSAALETTPEAPSEAAKDTESPDTAAADTAENIVATGQFTGAGDHVVTGGVEIVEVEGAYFIRLGDDFSLDDAPDPKVGLGQDGYDPSTKAGELVDFTGASSYQVPTGVNVEDYNEVHIWCERFNVPLGVASLVVAQ